MQQRRVCVAVDRSEASQAALRWAARSVVNGGDRVTLFNVVPPATDSELFQAPPTIVTHPAETDEGELQRSQGFLESCKAQLVSEGVRAGDVAVAPLVSELGTAQDIGRQLVKTSAECGCDTLVIGSRGLGLPKRALLNLLGLGSVSDYVIKHGTVNIALHKDATAMRKAADAMPTRYEPRSLR